MSQSLSMYQSRQNIIIPVNVRSVAASSVAASRIPRPVNVDTVSPTTARQSPIADIVSQFSSMTLSNSVKGANSTSPVVTKRQPKSLATSNVFTAKGVPVSDRIQERRKLIAAKLNLPANLPTNRFKRTKQPTPAPVPAPRKHVKLICHTLGRNYRQNVDSNISGPVKWFVDFSDRVLNTPSRIPADFSGRRPFTEGRYNIPTSIRPVWLPLLISSARGNLPYCESRCSQLNPDLEPLGYGLAYNGRECPCHGLPLQHGYHIGPRQWSTTPAEADVNPRRIRKVRFAGTTTDIPPTDNHGRWYRAAFWTPEDEASGNYSSYNADDPARIEDDDRALTLLDSAPPATPVKSSSIDLQAIFDECFPSDDED